MTEDENEIITEESPKIKDDRLIKWMDEDTKGNITLILLGILVLSAVVMFVQGYAFAVPENCLVIYQEAVVYNGTCGGVYDFGENVIIESKLTSGGSNKENYYGAIVTRSKA